MYITIIIICVFIIYFIYYIYKKKQDLFISINNNFGKKPENFNEDFNMSFVKQYYETRIKHEGNSESIDKLTWNDLDMDSVFKRTNYTSTTLGEAYLYYKYKQVHYDKDEITSLEKLINIFMKNKQLRNNVKMNLLKIGKMNNESLIDFIYEPAFAAIKGYFKYPLMKLLLLFAIIMIPLKTGIGIGFMVLCLAINALLYHSTKRYLGNNINVMIYVLNNITALIRLSKIKDKDFEEVKRKIESLLNDFHYAKRAKIYGIKLSISNSYGVISDLAFFMEYIKMFFMLDITTYQKAAKILEKNKDKLFHIYDLISQIDLSISIAYYRASLDQYAVPEFTESDELELIDAYHPLIDNAVKNSIFINNNIIFTGSNASGKSTFIKAVALNCIMAQSLNTALCSRYRGKFSKVITSMAIKDNVLSGESYFIAEIKSLKRLIDSLGSNIHTMVFIDEILKGTNTIERIAASASILNYASKYNNAKVLVATHDLELTKIIDKNYINYHFEETVTDDGVFFDYKLKNGVSKTRNAIKLLKTFKFDDNIVSMAEDLSHNFINNNEWNKIV